MKKINLYLFVLAACFCTADLMAQSEQLSPPASASGTVDGVQIDVKYFAPSARGREIMGELVPYGEVWRTGANNATKITFDQDVNIEGKPLKAGTYGLFTIPGEKEWTVIFNTIPDQWGAFNYDETKDALRVKVPAGSTGDMVEKFNIEVADKGVEMAWENTKVMFSVKKS